MSPRSPSLAPGRASSMARQVSSRPTCAWRFKERKERKKERKAPFTHEQSQAQADHLFPFFLRGGCGVRTALISFPFFFPPLNLVVLAQIKFKFIHPFNSNNTQANEKTKIIQKFRTIAKMWPWIKEKFPIR